MGASYWRGAILLGGREVSPESRGNGHDQLASLGLLMGFCLMMVMDTALALFVAKSLCGEGVYPRSAA